MANPDLTLDKEAVEKKKERKMGLRMECGSQFAVLVKGEGGYWID